MGGYVLKRHEDGRYVAPPGSRSSYTTDIARARRFPTRGAAQREACGNESAIPFLGHYNDHATPSAPR